MSKIQVLIEVDEEGFNNFVNDWVGATAMLRAVSKGKPLPKNHGDLKDVDAIHEEIYRLQSGIAKNGGAVIIKKDQYKGLCYARGIINEAPVIIEADGGEADEQKNEYAK